MKRPLLVIGAAAVGGYVVWQVLAAFVFPLLAALLGFVWTVLKIVLFVALLYAIYRLVIKAAREASEKPHTEA
jgi:membrane protein implicated in regulation of membrane protease activity